MVTPYTLIKFKDELYFTGRDDVRTRELWIVDDSDKGAHLFKDIDVSPNGGAPANFTVVGGGQMFFTAYLFYTGVSFG